MAILLPQYQIPQYQNEDAARAYLEKLLWPDGPVCPHCGIIGEATKMDREEGSDTHGRKGLYQCNACRKQFTVTVKSIFEDSKIPLHKWLLAFHLMCSSKKGVSALQLQRELELGSYRTAWFMCHRIRWAMTQTPMAEALKMKGIVEADETYVGGRWYNRHKDKRGGDGTGGPGTGKTAVVGAISRRGNVVLRVIDRADTKTLDAFVHEAVSAKVSLLATDEHSGYRYLSRTYPHQVITKAGGDYVVGAVHTNTIEGFWSILKRGIMGSYHKVSKKYLPLYVAEFQFRHNNRQNADIFGSAIAGC